MLQVTSRCYILADWILCKGNLRNDKKESKERHVSEQAVCEGYVQSHDAGGMAVESGEASGILAVLLRAETVTVQRE